MFSFFCGNSFQKTKSLSFKLERRTNYTGFPLEQGILANALMLNFNLVNAIRNLPNV